MAWEEDSARRWEQTTIASKQCLSPRGGFRTRRGGGVEGRFTTWGGGCLAGITGGLDIMSLQ